MTPFRALRHRNFRLFWMSQLASVMGTWMQSLALGWLVWRLTHSAFWLGIAGAMPFMPSLFLASIGGVMVDRHTKKKVLLITQCGMAIQAAALGLLTVSGAFRLYQIILLAAVAGVLMAIDMPARLAFVREIVGRDDIDNAIALNSMAFNAGRIVGPAVAGFLVPLVGEGGCFLINSVSFLPLIGTLLTMSTLEQARPRNRDSFASQLYQAWAFVRGHSTIYPLMVGLAFYGLFGFTLTVLMPIFADKVLEVGVRGLGGLMGAMGVGALSGAVVQATMPRQSARGRIIFQGSIGLAVAFLGFALSRWFLLSLALLAGAGFAMILMVTSLVTLILDLTPEELHGRVMGLYTTSFLGLMPIGTFLAGTLASGIGAPATTALGGVICLLVAILTLRPKPGLPSARQ
ncbi:MAG: MFS transporter [bacterium]